MYYKLDLDSIGSLETTETLAFLKLGFFETAFIKYPKMEKYINHRISLKKINSRRL